MGIGQALTEGTQFDEDGRQRNPHLLDYKLVTSADAPRIDIAWVETPTAERGPEGLEGHRRAAVRGDTGRDRERDRQGDRVAGTRAADDRRSGSGLRAGEATGEHVRRRRRPSRRPLPRWAAAPASSPAARISSSARVRARRPLPDSLVAIHAVESLRGITGSRRRSPPRRARRPTRRSWRTRSSASASRRSPTRRRSSARTRPAPGDDRRQRDERLAGHGDRRTARLLRRDGHAASPPRGSREVAVADLFSGPGQTTADAGELLVAVDIPAACRRAPAAATSGSSIAGRWRSPSSAPRRSSSLDERRGHGRRGSRSPRSRRRSAASPRRRPRSSAPTAAAAAAEAAAEAAAAGSAPISDVRASADVPSRDGRGHHPPRRSRRGRTRERRERPRPCEPGALRRLREAA